MDWLAQYHYIVSLLYLNYHTLHSSYTAQGFVLSELFSMPGVFLKFAQSEVVLKVAHFFGFCFFPRLFFVFFLYSFKKLVRTVHNEMNRLAKGASGKANFKKVFKELDKDGDGNLTMGELIEALSRMG